MEYTTYAEQEFRAAQWLDKDGKYSDEMQQMMCKQVLELLALFSKHGHSGTSAPYAVDLFKKLALFKPLTPLTGEDWEWRESASGKLQNKRCSHVFKEADGRAYDIDGRIFREPDGGCYSSAKSRVYIKFPYTPTTEYVDVPKPSDN